MTLARFDWQVYFASRAWALLKEQVRERSLGTCERCGVAPYQQTHHLNYKRPVHELLADLMAVCAACHEYLSGKRQLDPRLPITTRVTTSMGGDSWMGVDIAQVHCPICSFEYVHFGRPECIDGKDDYRARGEFVRGDVIAIPMCCESGHRFVLEIGFHKGGTFVRWNPERDFSQIDEMIARGSWFDPFDEEASA